MYFEIASVLGCTVGEMLRRMSSNELSEWVIFLSIKAQEQKEANERWQASIR